MRRVHVPQAQPNPDNKGTLHYNICSYKGSASVEVGKPIESKFIGGIVECGTEKDNQICKKDGTTKCESTELELCDYTNEVLGKCEDLTLGKTTMSGKTMMAKEKDKRHEEPVPPPTEEEKENKNGEGKSFLDSKLNPPPTEEEKENKNGEDKVPRWQEDLNEVKEIRWQEDLNKIIEKYVIASKDYDDVNRKHNDAKKTFDNTLKDHSLPKILEEAIRECDAIQKSLESTEKNHPLAKAYNEAFEKLKIADKVCLPLGKALDEAFEKLTASRGALESQLYKDRYNAYDKYHAWKTNPLYKDFFEALKKFQDADEAALESPEDIALKEAREKAGDDLLIFKKTGNASFYKDFIEDRNKWYAANEAFWDALKDDPRKKDLEKRFSEFRSAFDAYNKCDELYLVYDTVYRFGIAKKALDDVLLPLQEDLNKARKRLESIRREEGAILSPLQKAAIEILIKSQEELDVAMEKRTTAKNNMVENLDNIWEKVIWKNAVYEVNTDGGYV